MGQIERALNRLYGIEQDRPTMQKYGRAFVLALTAGVLATLAFAMFALGHGIGAGIGDDTVSQIWDIVRWPIALVLMASAIALLFRWAPRRHQPAWSWLAFGSTVSVLLWSLVTLGLGLFFQSSTTFSRTYGPLAGMIAILLWALLSSIADPVRCGARRPARGGARRGVVAQGRAQGRGAPGRRTRARRLPVASGACRWTTGSSHASERGNQATELDRRHHGGTAWTEGNDGRVLDRRRRVLRPPVRGAVRDAVPATGCTSPTGRVIPTRSSPVPGPRSAR